MSSSEVRRIHIEAWQTGSMSQAAYCRAQGLNTKTFGSWVRKHRVDQVGGQAALVAVTNPSEVELIQSTTACRFAVAM